MHTKPILWSGRAVTLACDGVCSKAWGVIMRPTERFDANDPDDCAMHADHELGTAPVDPRSYEGGCAKPEGPAGMNKWCSRQCERSRIFEADEVVTASALPSFDGRLYNQPWKHDLPREQF